MNFKLNTFAAGMIVAILVGLLFLGERAYAQSNDEKIFLWRFADNSVPRGPRAEAQKWWAAELEKRSNGRIKVEFFWNNSLVEGKDIIKAVGSGFAETGTVIGAYNPAAMPIWDISNMPFLFKDEWVAMKTLMEARQVIPELQDEARRVNVKILAQNTTSPAQILSRGAPILSTADLQGIKLRTLSYFTNLFGSLGAAPVTIGFGSVYLALDRGTVDASIVYTATTKAFKFYEVADQFTEANLGLLLGFGIGINLDIFNSLPPDLRQILLEVSDEYMSVLARLLKEDVVLAKSEMEQGIDGRKVIFHELPPSVRAQWKKAAEPVLENWKDAMKERGFDGEKILETIKLIQAKYTKEVEEKGYPWTR